MRPILAFLDIKHIGIDLLHLNLRLTDHLYELCLNKLSKMDKSNSSNMLLRPNLLIFLEFLEHGCKISNPWYVSEDKIKMRNLTGNERMKIFKVLFKNNKNITLGEGLENYKRNMAGLFGPNPDPIKRNQNDHFDWRLEFFVWHKFFRIFRLLTNFERKPIIEKEVFFNRLRLDLKTWAESYIQINKTYRGVSNISPYIHIFIFHSVELLQTYGKILNLLNCNSIEKFNHFSINYYHNSSNRNNTDLKYLKQMILKRNRVEYIMLEEYDRNEIYLDDDEIYYEDYDDDDENDISFKIKINKYFL